MEKLGLEKGLISYTTLQDYEANMALAGAGKHVKDPQIIPQNVRGENGQLSERVKRFSYRNFVRPRTIIYTAIYSIIGLALLVSLGVRDRLELKVLPDRNPQFVVLSDGSIRNGYELKILNMKGEAQQFLITVGGLRSPLIGEAGSRMTPRDWLVTNVSADKAKALKVFVTVRSDDLLTGSTPFSFTISQMGSTEHKTVPATFEAPKE
jgi:polyferredoxin